ncbi:hypothetical protein O6H91_07G100100 [Diphasiastrum complanatum]|uniref:Uncharacterized protein n=1 Tax=Diphasiastrum complanatum TaxID=34168 RepID=A0ACC2D7Y8_DIPCM|nr:hypothetical protein O6H91_07G100100 [Diphasiastrum complanatum]
MLVHINLQEENIRVLLRKLCKDWRHGLARAAPGCCEVHNNLQKSQNRLKISPKDRQTVKPRIQERPQASGAYETTSQKPLCYRSGIFYEGKGKRKRQGNKTNEFLALQSLLQFGLPFRR